MKAEKGKGKICERNYILNYSHEYSDFRTSEAPCHEHVGLGPIIAFSSTPVKLQAQAVTQSTHTNNSLDMRPPTHSIKPVANHSQTQVHGIRTSSTCKVFKPHSPPRSAIAIDVSQSPASSKARLCNPNKLIPAFRGPKYSVVQAYLLQHQESIIQAQPFPPPFSASKHANSDKARNTPEVDVEGCSHGLPRPPAWSLLISSISEPDLEITRFLPQKQYDNSLLMPKIGKATGPSDLYHPTDSVEALSVSSGHLGSPWSLEWWSKARAFCFFLRRRYGCLPSPSWTFELRKEASLRDDKNERGGYGLALATELQIDKGARKFGLRIIILVGLCRSLSYLLYKLSLQNHFQALSKLRTR